MKRKIMAALSVAAMIFAPTVFGQQATEGARNAQRFVLAVSEGTSGGIGSADALDKYRPLAEIIGKAAGAQIQVVLARDFKNLEESMQRGLYQLVMARPSDYPARGIRDYGYSLIATAAPEGMCTLIVSKDSPLKSIKDVKGSRIVLPEQVAYMTRFCTAALRDEGIVVATENVKYTREQDVVAFSVESGFADVGGVASYSGVARDWEKKGHRVLYRSRPQPYFPLIASKALSDQQVAKVRVAVLNLDKTGEGREALKRLGIQGFVATDPQRLLDLLKWLG
jgi:ABC-type phosphate/phosphonate transport system substrate-binding protein